MNRALNQISKSPFTRRIEEARLPRRFNQPTFTIYNGKTDPVEHVSHFNQKMAVYARDEALMCKVFPSSMGPVAMRWFDGLKAGSINSFKELTQVLEMFNEVEGNNDAMALSTFKLGLPTDHGLRASLSGKPVANVRQLMDRIEKYKRVEEDQQQGKGKDKVISQERRDSRSDRYNYNKPRRDFAGNQDR
ncbi:uncharacterized protein LOC136070257 [Quercus suber]|uniref:uncharacterized protein LOC136070257 n=1 Tax=Quercus suber TaxID=58331 RepID=UPI0032E01D4C